MAVKIRALTLFMILVCVFVVKVLPLWTHHRRFSHKSHHPFGGKTHRHLSPLWGHAVACSWPMDVEHISGDAHDAHELVSAGWDVDVSIFFPESRTFVLLRCGCSFQLCFLSPHLLLSGWLVWMVMGATPHTSVPEFPLQAWDAYRPVKSRRTRASRWTFTAARLENSFTDAARSHFGIRVQAIAFSFRSSLSRQVRRSRYLRHRTTPDFDWGWGHDWNGEGGIRTHGCFHIAGFQDQSHQPLDHLSLWDNWAVILLHFRAVLLGLHDLLERCKTECFSSIQWYYAWSFHTTYNVDFKTLYWCYESLV